MKYTLLFLLSCAMVLTPIQAGKPFFSERTKMISAGTLMGSLAGLFVSTAGGLIYESIQTKTYQSQFVIDSIGTAQIMAATTVGFALLGGYLGYKSEKEFESNKFQHLMNAQNRFTAFKNNKSIKNALACSDITEIEEWFEKADHKKSYSNIAPLVSGFDFLREWRDELIELSNLNQKLSQYFDGQELITIENDLESIHKYINQVNALLVILVPHTPRSHYYVPARNTLNYVQTNTGQTSPTLANTQSMPSAPSTMSPILNGNVYGTIWSNY